MNIEKDEIMIVVYSLISIVVFLYFISGKTLNKVEFIGYCSGCYLFIGLWLLIQKGYIIAFITIVILWLLSGLYCWLSIQPGKKKQRWRHIKTWK
jgi:hypothetical protein